MGHQNGINSNIQRCSINFGSTVELEGGILGYHKGHAIKSGIPTGISEGSIENVEIKGLGENIGVSEVCSIKLGSGIEVLIKVLGYT